MARRNDPPKRVHQTLGELEGQFWINIYCTKWGCSHSVTFDATDLADRFGQDYSVERMLARFRCERCGTRGATLTLWSPRRPDGLDKVRSARKREAAVSAQSAGGKDCAPSE